MIRRGLLAVALAAASVVLGAAPAQAIPSENLTVVKHYDVTQRVDLVLFLTDEVDQWGCRQHRS